ncbi:MULTISPECIES: AI-2E family transporter [unclassified Citrobacter]|uniref:AI-2E family transporter n=1 Tax=unclassified Citrobacter TaxID=2644389 RepID=UPI0015E9BA5B|nr:MULTISPECIES: AI-2E family transporter [unclassified Citrobacter]MBA7876172.1 AI-2E family transporter [Citrobacter sp. RHBSTW-00827]MBA7938787.1 AI-2E family transporter [Citrobacter sp. RHBSTW-00509]QLS94827.1 AI-2E family transporter [Citrobacter sp. RHBSTW-00859]QLT54210.1 AI-2E family transporter [Citrobacter sp. RHBSTW-00821]QLU30491.1 AI-2E family transporter [Citrobacter sp. RHBSTW-00446]
MAKPIITLSGLKIVIMLGMLVIILSGIRVAADIIVPFILALFIAVVLNPVVQRMVKLRIPRVIAVSLLIVIIVMLMVLLLAYLGTSLNELARTLPQYRSSLVIPLKNLEPWLQRAGIGVSVDELVKYIDPNAAMTLVTNLLAQLSNAMSSIFLLLLTVVFMLLEVPQLPNKLKQMMSRPIEGMAAIQRAIDSVSHYLVLKTAISIVTGLVAWGMLAALDVRFAFVWGLLAFALNYIPNIGSVLAAIPPIAQVLVFSGLYDALVVLAGYLVINLVFGNILEPRIMGRGLGLSTLVVFLSLIFWGWLLGPVGMLLSVPLTIIVKIALEQTNGGQSIAVLLSDLNKE